MPRYRKNCSLLFNLLRTPTAVAGGGGSVFTSVCLCVRFPHDISKTDATRITKFDIRMFHDESWKPILFWRQKVKAQGHESQKQYRRESLPFCECRLPLLSHGDRWLLLSICILK